MASRNARSYRAFVHDALQLDGHSDVYDGVLCLGARGGVEFAQGCFEQVDDVGSSRHHFVRVTLDAASDAALFDTRQITSVFDHVTRRALQQEAQNIKQEMSERDDRRDRASSPLPPAIHVGDETFQVVSASFTTVCAVARGHSHTLVAEKLPFGTLVVLTRTPLAHIVPLLSRCCAPLRQ